MIITLTGVSKGRRGSALPETSIEFSSGRASLAVAETAQRPSVLGLLASGRMRPDTGEVSIDGQTDYAQMRRRIALIDAPDVNDPDVDVTVYGIIAEELMFAGRPAGPVSVRRAISELGYHDWQSWTIGTVPAIVRIRLLTELATMRQNVDALVITAPDRHGGDPADWWTRATDLAARGFAVLVIAGVASATALGLPTIAGGVFHATALGASSPQAIATREAQLTLERDREVERERERPDGSDHADYTARDADTDK